MAHFQGDKEEVLQQLLKELGATGVISLLAEAARTEAEQNSEDFEADELIEFADYLEHDVQVWVSSTWSDLG